MPPYQLIRQRVPGVCTRSADTYLRSRLLRHHGPVVSGRPVCTAAPGSYYVVQRHLFDDPDAFVPVTGALVRPEFLLVPGPPPRGAGRVGFSSRVSEDG